MVTQFLHLLVIMQKRRKKKKLFIKVETNVWKNVSFRWAQKIEHEGKKNFQECWENNEPKRQSFSFGTSEFLITHKKRFQPQVLLWTDMKIRKNTFEIQISFNNNDWETERIWYVGTDFFPSFFSLSLRSPSHHNESSIVQKDDFSVYEHIFLLLLSAHSMNNCKQSWVESVCVCICFVNKSKRKGFASHSILNEKIDACWWCGWKLLMIIMVISFFSFCFSSFLLFVKSD